MDDMINSFIEPLFIKVRGLSLSMFGNIRYQDLILSYPVSHCVQPPYHFENEICLLICIWLLLLGLLLSGFLLATTLFITLLQLIEN